MKVLSLVISTTESPLPKESKEKSCNFLFYLFVFQYYIDNNVLVVYNVYVVTSHQKKGARGFVKILISNTSDTPLYQQIKDQIKDAILKEELVEGDALPSIRAFANDLKVSVLTIRRVYEELEQEGFIVSQVGIGTFVSTSNLELLRDSKRRLVEQKMADMIQTAKSLKISKEELNSMMIFLRGVEMNDILTVSGLNKSYGDFSLKDVTFSLPEGCITGFIGVNGAGKTTTLRTLLGLTNKLSGKIQFFGLDMDKNEKRNQRPYWYSFRRRGILRRTFAG